MKVIDRTLQILETLGADGTGAGVTRLAEQLGEAPSTVHRLLAVLLRHHLVVQDTASRRYRLGPGVLALGEAYLRQSTLISVARPHLAEVSLQTLESVFLTEYVNGDAICVATAESPRPLRFFMHVGQRMPYHAAASARAILAFRSDDEAERLLREEALQRFTATTPTTVGEALSELKRVREAGYAACDEEMEVGVAALSVPIQKAGGEVVASLSIVGPQQRLAGERRGPSVRLLQETAAAISTALGHRAPGPRDPVRPAEAAVVAADGSSR